MKKDIREESQGDLEKFFTEAGEKAFRGKQVYEWLWKTGARSFDQMTNLSLQNRELLAAAYQLPSLSLAEIQKSKDGTMKFAFSADDGFIVEGVMIPSKDRITACISSQVGCPLNCRFCATASLKTRRNLSCGEIVDQVRMIQETEKENRDRTLSNIVFMGMGEPLLNYDAVLAGIEKITSPGGLGISPKRITLSTVGITEGIRRLADDKIRFNLAVSLHHADNEKRTQIMPVNKSNPLPQISDSLKYFYEKTGTRISYEYLLLAGFNDSLEDASRLAKFCRITPCKVNLIEYNEVPGSPYKKSPAENADSFADFLRSLNMVVNVRKSRGQDIDAACGQLAGKKSRK